MVTTTASAVSVATGVILTDELPLGVTLVSTTPTQGTCDEAAGVVTCNLGDLNPGASATVEIVVTPTVGGEISNTASVTSDVFDPNPVNNSATEITTVSRLCPLDLAPSYEAGTLTIDVSVGTSVAAIAEMWECPKVIS